MPASRLEILQQLLLQNPSDSFARYGIAMEHVRGGEYEQAVAEFRTLIVNDPNYAYAYFHGGQALEKLDRIEDARQMYRAGIEAAGRAGNAHARSELQAALDILGE